MFINRHWYEKIKCIMEGHLKKTVEIGLLMLALLYIPNIYAGWELDVKFIPGKWSSENKYVAKVTSWDTNDVTPNPVYGCISNCTLAIGFKGNEVGYQMDFKEIITSKTLGELAGHFARRGYLNRQYTSREGQDTKGGCFYLGYFTKAGEGSGYDLAPLPGGMTCVPPEIDPLFCNISEPQLELNHGMLRSDQINGHTVSTQLHVKCNSNFKVRIMASDRSGSIYFNGLKGFRSELQVDGVSLGEGKQVQATPQGVGLTLSSTLTGYDGSIGEFHGSKTIIVSLP
ncbi:Uncharacterised protein [Serratia marcescens]|uniref:MrpH family fimbial adhesin n=1 Tax=Serratia marcescens TaxID=615 RepID=UPI0018D79DA2|nr:hypothetical protein [Serratia marcescens]MBH2526198.1 hypothetical protein [Serratia marcescens]MBH2888068.1 hypothetical protein [Serratia marcescens]MBH3137824.1 hypothetical protein [Serratia marcescens]CAI1844088.1 Uncharacterised protein [Serratia marcescens]HEJ6943733.1 hypothetical protein [Serratia marcescens]